MIFKLHEVIDFILPNQERHAKEAKEIGMLEYEDVSVDFDYYLAMSQLGRCFVFMRDGDYAVFTINENPLHFDKMEAVNDIFYVSDRKNTKKFIQDSVAAIKGLGIHKVNFLVKSDKVARFLSMCGLKKTHTLMSI